MINLLPDAIKRGVRYARLNAQLIRYIFLVVLVGVGLLSIMVFGLIIVQRNEQRLNKILAQKEQQIKELEPKKQEAKKLSDTVNSISTLLSSEVKFSELLQKIGAIMPQGARLSGLTLNTEEQKPLQITAELDRTDIVATLQKNLVESDLFEAVDIQTVNPGEQTEEQSTAYYTATLVASFETEQKSQGAKQ